MGFLEAGKIMNEMKEGGKYISFSNKNDFVILDDDFNVEELEAILTTLKGKK